MHVSKVQVKKSHFDSYGHINNASYMSLFEEARWNLLNEYGLGMEYIQRELLGPVLLEANIKFLREIKEEGELVIHTFFNQFLKDSIVQMSQKMFLGDVLASEMIMSTGLMDLKKRKLVSFSDEWHEMLEACE